MTNVGTQRPIMASDIGKWSQAVFCLNAAIMPASKPENQRDDQRFQPSSRETGKASRNNLIDSAAWVFEGGAEVALQQVFHLQQVLLEQRFIQTVMGFHARADLLAGLFFRSRRGRRAPGAS